MVELLVYNENTDLNALSIYEYRYYQHERRKQFKKPLLLAIQKL